jgi:malate synthase
VPVATEEFDAVLGERPNQVERLREDVEVSAADLLSVPDTPGTITDEGVAANVRVGVGYLDSWLRGVGAAAIDNLMEDVATAEISRSQLWQWVRHGKVSRERVLEGIERVESPEEAKEVFTEVALADEFVEFLTLPAYDRLG